MKRNFLLETAILSVCCANVNNAGVCDCCSVCSAKKFIAKALGIKKDDIWFIEKFKGKNHEEELKKLSDKKGEEFGNRVKNSHVVLISEVNVDDTGKPKEDDVCYFFALIDNGKIINPSSELLDKVNDEKVFFANNRGKKVKIILVIEKNGESKKETLYSCKKN